VLDGDDEPALSIQLADEGSHEEQVHAAERKLAAAEMCFDVAELIAELEAGGA
jgi:hypothetical protein